MRIPVTPVREEISARLDKGLSVDFIPEIILVERRNSLQDKVAGFNCVRYRFGKELPRFIPYKNHFLFLPIEDYTEVKPPLPGSFAIFISGCSRFGLEFEHMGIVTTGGKVLSKGGYGDVYLHPQKLFQKNMDKH